MVSSVATEKLTANLKVDQYLSGNASTAKDIGFVDMRDYSNIMVVSVAAALTGIGITVFQLVANSQADGNGDEVVVKQHAIGSAPDAAGDYLVLECSAEEIAHLGEAAGYDLRYVSAKITCANASDRIVCTYIRAGARRPGAGLTADYVSA